MFKKAHKTIQKHRVMTFAEYVKYKPQVAGNALLSKSSLDFG